MADQLKYYYGYGDSEGETYKVEIWEDTEDTLVAEELYGSGNDPFLSEWLGVELFSPVKGCGFTLNIISETARKYLSLFTNDMKRFKIKHYQGTTLLQQGYLDSELFNEQFTREFNYPVSFTGNDGMSLLDRLYFLQSSGDHYVGVVTKWYLLQEIFTQIGLPITNIYVSVKTSVLYYHYSTGVKTVNTGATGDSIFQISKVNCANYYDELGKPVTSRVVLESLLSCYGAFCYFYKGNLYILDIQTIADNSSTTFKKYSGSTWLYVEDEVIDLRKDISVIGLIGGSPRLEVVPAYNAQKIRFLPYSSNPLLDLPIEVDDFDPDDQTDYITHSGIEEGWITWYEAIYEAHPYYTLSNGAVFALIITPGEYGVPELGYIKYQLTNNPNDRDDSSDKVLVATHSIETPYINRCSNYVNVTMDVYIRTKEQYENPDEDGGVVYGYDIYGYVKMGGLYYKKSTRTWETTPQIFTFGIRTTDGTNWADKWHNTNDFSSIVPAELIDLSKYYGVASKLTIEIWSHVDTYYESAGAPGVSLDYKDIIEVRIKNLKVQTFKTPNYPTTYSPLYKDLVDTSDFEYFGEFNPLWKNEADDIELWVGTRVKGIERGGLIENVLIGTEGYADIYIPLWRRNSVDDKIERLLMKDIMNNRAVPSIKITNINVKAKGVDITNILTYNYPFTGKLFYISSLVSNYRLNRTTLTLLEVNTSDDVTLE